MIIKKGNFSELFPNTFAYLKTFVAAKYPDLKELPDVKVLIIDQITLKGIFLSIITGTFSSSMHYHRYANRIIIFLNSYLSRKGGMKKIKENPNLAAKYLDTNNQAKSHLIHEYQHFLQIKLRKFTDVQAKVDIPKELKKGNFKKRVIGEIRKEIRRGPIYGFVFGSFKGAAIGLLISQLFDRTLKRVAPKTEYLTSKKVLYFSDPKELEARITQMIYNIVNGKAHHDFDIVMKENEEKLKSSIFILVAGIEEQQNLLENLDITLEDKKLIKKRIKLMEKLLWEYEEKLKLVPLMTTEAERIVHKIRNDLVQ